ncbi:MAG: hypothetical protein MR673_04015 [Fusobacterium perfoetens]|uniref:DUF6630 family protein n=1 Tax=Fusobacterium perfoetens TaxID=852 RepID=UPI0023F135F4|nr:DUF6630 family protein [Fusobacterium perfoetens]MCI6152277.1 hypothetical protein [Fusobacterium perfoetens]MDY3238135.1 DUF6630 family protein [Fusobacterium perfoetens]
MKKYNLSAEEMVKFLYRGKIKRVKEEDIYSFYKNPSKIEIEYFKEHFVDKSKYKISWKEIEETEKRLGVFLPKILREYYHECGDLDINTSFSELFKLEDIEFSHNWLREDLEEDEYSEEEIKKELEKIDNFLIFWCENQGVWNAGIKKEDLELENPPIYITTNDDLYSWAKITNDIETFIIFQIIDNINDSDFYNEEIEKEDLKDILLDKKISLEEIRMSNFLSSNKKIKCSSYADYDNDKIYFFILENDMIKKAYLVKPKEKKVDYGINEKIDNGLLIELGNIISNGDNEVINQLKCSFDNIRKYLIENKEFIYMEKDIDNMSNSEIKFVKFYILSQILEKNGYLYYLDWKCELEDFKMIENLLKNISNDYSLDNIEFDEDDDITTWSEIFDEEFKSKNILLASFDLDSDTYGVFLISYKEFERIEKLLKNSGLRIDFTKNL